MFVLVCPQWSTGYVGFGRVSLLSNRKTASRFVFSVHNRAQLYGGVAQPHCAMKTKLEKQKSKHLYGTSDGCLSENKRMKLLQFLSKDLSVLLSTSPADANVYPLQSKSEEKFVGFRDV